jgi:acetylglutamate kinase
VEHVTAPVWVVKIGGRLCEERDSRMRLARACAAWPGPLVVVHGGGDAVTRLQTRLGMQPRFEAGRRVTSPDEMAVVEWVLGGGVNPGLVRALEACGRRAVGVAGSDAGMLRCTFRPGLGRVGEPAGVDPQLLSRLLAAGYTPVVCPVGLGPDGEPVNVNADEAAAAIAAALGAESLLLLSDVEGVRVGDAWQADVAVADVDALVASGEVTRGMIPKLHAAAAAARGGVREVRIAGFAGGELDAVRGTRVRATTQVGG